MFKAIRQYFTHKFQVNSTGLYSNTNEYAEEVWKKYTEGINAKKNKKLILLWLFALVFIGSVFLLHSNQGRISINQVVLGEEFDWPGRVRMEIGIFDGLKLKKALIGPISDDRYGSRGVIKESIGVDKCDFDNDGQLDLLVSARDEIDRDLMYFFRIGEDGLERINVLDNANQSVYHDDGSLYAQNISFAPKTDSGKYSFAAKDLIDYSNAQDVEIISLYEFTDKNELALVKKEKKQVED